MTERAISPVVGVALMIVIVTALAAVVGGLMLDFEDRLQGPGPQVAVEVTDYHPDGHGNGGKPYLEIHHAAGDIADGTQVFVVDDDGDRVAWTDIWTTGPTLGPGSYAHIDGCGSDGELDRITEKGQVYRVIFETDGGKTLTVREVTVPSKPDPKPC